MNATIWFTYLCYDNQKDEIIYDFSDELYRKLGKDRAGIRSKITNKKIYDKNEIHNKIKEISCEKPLFICDKAAIISEVASYKVPTLALITNHNREVIFTDIRYCISDIAEIEYYYLNRIWQRYMNIPWIIAKTDRMIIREHTLEDVEEICEIYEDPDIRLYMKDFQGKIEEDISYMKEYIANQYSFYEFGIWALVERSTGRLIGRAGISLRDGYDDAEIGYCIRREYRGKGYAKEALGKIIEYAYYELGMEGLNAFVSVENSSSIRLLEALDFARKDSCVIDGNRHYRYVSLYSQSALSM